MTRSKPLGFKVAPELIAEHEIGHLFGLKHPDGGVMSDKEKVFRLGEFKDEWCPKIKEHLNRFTVK